MTMEQESSEIIESGSTPVPEASETHDPLQGLRPWMLRVVGLVQAGMEPIEAATQCKVSPATLAKWTPDGSAFAIALARATAGVALVGKEHVRQVAQAQGMRWLEHVMDRALHSEYDRDKATFTRMWGEAGEHIGPGAVSQATAASYSASQVSILIVGANKDQQQALLRDALAAKLPPHA